MVSSDTLTGGKCEDLEAVHDQSCLGHDAKSNKLLLGRYKTSPQELLRAIVILFISFFALHRLADVVYLLQVDCRFPKGLDYDYASDVQRQQAVSYVRNTICVSFLQHAVNFVIVLTVVLSGALLSVDSFLEKTLSCVQEMASCCCCGCCKCCFGFAFSCLESILHCFGFKPKWAQLLRGAIFMSMMGVFFCAVNTPFKLWIYHINVNFGFTNVLTTSQSMMLDSIFQSVIHLLITGIPSFMVYLLLLSHRWGWLIMYTGTLTVSVFVQYNVGTLGPSLFGASAIFPGNDFGVGDGFPLGGDAHNVSLNRIFYPVDNSSENRFRTSDFSSGQLNLEPVDGKKRTTPWRVTETGAGGGQLAVTTGEILSQKGRTNLDQIEEQDWSFDNGDSADGAHIGVRRGKRLRDELFGFAEERNIHVKEVYMIDGSHADTRANAFAAGAGRDRIIGLYDTLFLGSTVDDSAVDDTTGILNAGELFSVGSLGSRLRGVDRSEGEMRRKRRSTPVQAMTDIEILAVMGHELGHTALHHSEGGMGVEAVTSFLTFAVLGWAVNCPVLAASMGFAAPVVHIGVFLYNRIISPPLDISVGIITSAISRANENAADAYSARVSEEYAEGLQTALGKLTINSNNDPNEPWYYEVLHDDHPTTAKRWANVNRIRRKLYAGD